MPFQTGQSGRTSLRTCHWRGDWYTESVSFYKRGNKSPKRLSNLPRSHRWKAIELEFKSRRIKLWNLHFSPLTSLPPGSRLIPLQAQRAILKVGSQLLELQLPKSAHAACWGSVWPSCYGHCSVARLQFHGWESVLLCENSGRGVFGGTAMHSAGISNVLLDCEPAECSNCLRVIHAVFLA